MFVPVKLILALGQAASLVEPTRSEVLGLQTQPNFFLAPYWNTYVVCCMHRYSLCHKKRNLIEFVRLGLAGELPVSFASITPAYIAVGAFLHQPNLTNS
jgi:hypothetical protein